MGSTILHSSIFCSVFQPSSSDSSLKTLTELMDSWLGFSRFEVLRGRPQNQSPSCQESLDEIDVDPQFGHVWNGHNDVSNYVYVNMHVCIYINIHIPSLTLFKVIPKKETISWSLEAKWNMLHLIYSTSFQLATREPAGQWDPEPQRIFVDLFFFLNADGLYSSRQHLKHLEMSHVNSMDLASKYPDCLWLEHII